MWHPRPFFSRRLCSPDLKLAIDGDRVAIDDLAPEPLRHRQRQSRLPAGRWTNNHHQQRIKLRIGIHVRANGHASRGSVPSAPGSYRGSASRPRAGQRFPHATRAPAPPSSWYRFPANDYCIPPSLYPDGVLAPRCKLTPSMSEGSLLNLTPASQKQALRLFAAAPSRPAIALDFTKLTRPPANYFAKAERSSCRSSRSRFCSRFSNALMKL